MRRHDLCRHCRPQRIGGDDAFAVIHTVVQHHRHPACHVMDGGTDTAGGRLRVGLALVFRLPPVTDSHVSHRMVRLAHEVGEARAGRSHAEGLVEHLLGQARPVRVRGCGNRLGGRGDAEVRIGIIGAKLMKLREAQALQYLPAVISKVFQLVAGVVGQSRTVGVHVGDRDVMRDPVVAQGEPRQVLDQLRVPGDHARPNLMRNDRCSDRFRQRGQLEHRVGVHRVIAADATHAEALRVHGLVIAHDRDGQAGNVRSAEQVCREIIQPADRRVDLPWWNDIGGGLRWRHCRIDRDRRRVGIRCHGDACPNNCADR